MKGCTDKDAILDFFVANYLNCKWPKSQPCQTPPSVFPPKKHKICILKIKIWYHVKILVVLHHLQKEWKFSDQRWACNICLLLWTSKMSISTAWPIVQWKYGSQVHVPLGPLPFGLPLIGLPLIGLPPIGLPPFGLGLRSFGLGLPPIGLPPFGLSHLD